MLPIETIQLHSPYFTLLFVHGAAAQWEIVLHVMHSFIPFLREDKPTGAVKV